MKLTEAQRRILETAARNPLGVVTCPYSNGLAKTNWGRNILKLKMFGKVRPYVHGGYEITSVGRAAIAQFTPTCAEGE